MKDGKCGSQETIWRHITAMTQVSSTLTHTYTFLNRDRVTAEVMRKADRLRTCFGQRVITTCWYTECCLWENYLAWAVEWMVVPLIEWKGWGRNKLITSLFWVSLTQWGKIRVHFSISVYWYYSGNILFHLSHFVVKYFDLLEILFARLDILTSSMSPVVWGLLNLHTVLLWIVLVRPYPFYFFSILFFSNYIEVWLTYNKLHKFKE